MDTFCGHALRCDDVTPVGLDLATAGTTLVQHAIQENRTPKFLRRISRPASKNFFIEFLNITYLHRISENHKSDWNEKFWCISVKSLKRTTQTLV